MGNCMITEEHPSKAFLFFVKVCRDNFTTATISEDHLWGGSGEAPGLRVGSFTITDDHLKVCGALGETLLLPFGHF